MEDKPSLLLLTPSANAPVSAEVYDPEEASGALEDWFVQRAENVGAAGSQCRPSNKNSYVTCVVKIDGHDNYLYGMQLNDGRYRFVRFNMGTVSAFGAFRYVGALSQIVRGAQTSAAQSSAGAQPQQSAQAASGGRGGWKKLGDAAPPTPEAQSETAQGQPKLQIRLPQSQSSQTQTLQTQPPQTQPLQTPGQTQLATQPPSNFMPQMTGLYLHEEYGFGVGGMMIIEHNPYVLFPDGTITSDLDYMPSSEADIARWRAREPKHWGNWTKNGANINIRWNDPRSKPETWEKWYVARPGTEGMPMAGFYQSLGGGGNTALGGTVMIAAWKDFDFSPNGTVVKGGGSGSMTDGPGASVATSSTRRPGQANYRIHPHSIELQYADGHSERRWFYLFPDSDDVIGIGESTYIRKDDEKKSYRKSR